ncbi:MAG: hypothetical protein HDR09_01610 [Lachnospiraceae bacterium]|nr:hypothetical protein [Lachnospiraceae bacterium]
MPRSKQTKWQLADSFVCLRSDRAKPVSEMKRSGIERHCGEEVKWNRATLRRRSEVESSDTAGQKYSRIEQVLRVWA